MTQLIRNVFCVRFYIYIYTLESPILLNVRDLPFIPNDSNSFERVKLRRLLYDARLNVTWWMKNREAHVFHVAYSHETSESKFISFNKKCFRMERIQRVYTFYYFIFFFSYKELCRNVPFVTLWSSKVIMRSDYTPNWITN